MFAEYYGFNAMPFQLTPDSRFFYSSSVHARAIAHLIYGLSQQEGFIIVTGEVGAGKTTLVERLWSQLDRSTYTIARIVTSQVSGDDLLRLTAAAFGAGEGSDKATLLRGIEAILREHRAAGRRALLVVDEVQSLSIAGLEELRMLSNITDDGHALLQTILLGQPQFRRILASPELEQLRQRVLASFHLGPLNEDETHAYIEFRLRAAGWAGNPSFEPEVFPLVFRHTGGIPRRINRLCSRLLLYGALEERAEISAAMVETTARELLEDLGSGHPGPAMTGPAPLPGTAQAAGALELAHLAHRMDALEHALARRERVFQRFIDLLGTLSEVRRP